MQHGSIQLLPGGLSTLSSAPPLAAAASGLLPQFLAAGGAVGVVQERLARRMTKNAGGTAGAEASGARGASLRSELSAGLRGISEELVEDALGEVQGDISQAWAAVLAGYASTRAGGAGGWLPGDLSSLPGSLHGMVSSGVGALRSMESLQGRVSQGVAEVQSAGAADGSALGSGKALSASTDAASVALRQRLLAAGSSLSDASADGEPSLAHVFHEIEQRLQVVSTPLVELEGHLNAVQRPLQKIESRLESLERAVPCAALPVSFVREQVTALSASRVVTLVVSNWDYLQPDWMKEVRAWLWKVGAMWKQKRAMKVKVFRVNADVKYYGAAAQ
eukprot:jgi/Ulvmu1/12272/UM087_0006.1